MSCLYLYTLYINDLLYEYKGSRQTTVLDVRYSEEVILPYMDHEFRIKDLYKRLFSLSTNLFIDRDDGPIPFVFYLGV